ncbi:hypothetical protein MMC17_006863 [Xylographa soralifera]|nr:hypothetical protein [Xylographa soralifera]MCJ1383749.1 hypothetical protein [Xylographa soralifera]
MPPLRPLVRHFPRPSLSSTSPAILSLSTHPASSTPSPPSAARTFTSSTSQAFSKSGMRCADTPHESHYDPPSGWLFGIPPDEKYKKEGWENVWVWGFWGSLGVAVVAYAYKPDSS